MQTGDQVVTGKAGDLLLLPDGALADCLTECKGGTGSLFAGVGTLHHFHELHNQSGVIEVHVAQTGGIGQAVSKQRRNHIAGVGADDHIFADQLVQLTEEVGLHFLDLHNALDDAVHASDSLLQRCFQVETLADRSNLLFGHTTLGNTTSQVIVFPGLHSIQHFGLQVIDCSVEAVDR